MSQTERTTILDLDAYLKRIGWDGEPRADLATLRGLHTAHARSIPFENLDPVRGVVPSLRPDDIAAKLVHSRRGGYCYEHNTLFAGVLEALGLRVTRLAARVVVGAERFDSRPRTHMALLVEAPGDPRPRLADVGYGTARSLLEPVPLVTGAEFHAGGRRHRLVHAPDTGPLETWVLQAHGPAGTDATAGWEAQYAFTLDPFAQPDFEVANWYVGAHPRSPFSRRPYLQKLAPDRHLLLDGHRFTETHDDGTVTARELTDETEARHLVEERFEIDVPDGVPLLGRAPLRG